MKWKPKPNQYYYFVVLDCGSYVWTRQNMELHIDAKCIKLGNCFRTKKEAQLKLQAIKRILKEK